MIIKQAKCPSCGGPQDSKLVKLSEWNCEWCGDHLRYKNDVVEVLPTTTQNSRIDTKDNNPTAPESPLFTAISVLYLLIVGAAIICSIFKFVENQTVLIVIGLTASTNLYIGISGFAIAKSDQNKAPEPSNPTTLAVFAWLIVNILLMVVGFPVAILTRIIATFLYFVVGLIIGSIEVNPPQKQKQ